MKADIRYCATCMLNTIVTEMNLFHASEEMQIREFTDFLKILPDQCDGVQTPITIQDNYVRRLRELSGMITTGRFGPEMTRRCLLLLIQFSI